MKKIFILFFLLIGCVPQVFYPQVTSFIGSPNLREYRNLAIFPFSDAPGAPYSGQLVQGLASQSFAKFGFNVVEREKLAYLLREQELSMSGLIDESKSLRIGKMVGARAIVIGNVGQYASYQRKTDTTYVPFYNPFLRITTYIPVQGKQWVENFVSMSLRIIDVETGQLIYSGSGQYEVGLTNPPQQMAEFILRDIIATWRSGGRPLRGQNQQDLPESRQKPPSFSSTSFEGWHMLSAGKLNNVMIEKRTSSEILISYPSGVMKGTSTDGVMYNGEWHGEVKWGRWEIRFDSQDEATGWSDNKGIGEKFPMKLGKKD